MADTTITNLTAATAAAGDELPINRGGLDRKILAQDIAALGNNIGLAVSAASGALTVALKGVDGNDPSATNAVTIGFRNVTEATGTPTFLTVTAAASIVIASGATLGVVTSTAFRLWVVAFNDGGTFRLGLINCSSCSTTACTIFPLTPWGVASGAVASGTQAAGLFATTATVTSKAYTVLGFVEWNSTGLTAGTWTTTNLSRIQLFGPGVPLPGHPVQHSSVTGAKNDSTTSTTFVATTSTLAITPTSAVNILVIRAMGSLTAGAASANAFAQLSRGTTAATNMIGSDAQTSSAGGLTQTTAVMSAWDKPNVVSSQTYEVQFKGSASTTTWGFGALVEMEITEIMG